METITKTREIPYNVYIAVDGTVFDDENSCIAYEGTVICTLRKRLKIRKTDPWELCYGYEDNSVEIISGDKFDMQMYLSHLSQSCHSSTRDEIDEIIRNIKEDEEIIIFSNCDDYPYVITTKEKLIERLKNAYKNAE